VALLFFEDRFFEDRVRVDVADNPEKFLQSWRAIHLL
jgi:hypothetical protein